MDKKLDQNVSLDDHEEVMYSDLSRRAKRSLIFHLLYAMESFDYQEPLQTIVDNINRGYNFDVPLDADEVKTVQDIVDKREELDTVYIPLLSNWRAERLGVATKLILQYAIWEMLYTDTEKTIILNEAIELAKCFAEKDAYKFINGILDKIAESLDKK